MASLLRQIVARPRARHVEANLDLCYVTEHIIATSGPSSTYPQRAYRNPLPDLVKFLNAKHGEDWCIWEFRAEGTGYPDEAVFGRIWHFPWPDHHPPPFRLLPNVVASMRDWRNGGKDRVIVVHCKAGKGRSGTASISYLISEEGWELQDALKRFTERRMRLGWGQGVSIPSQLRWLTYVERWKNNGKKYVERQVEVVELHVYGLRDGVKLAVEGFIDEGKKIKAFHTFRDSERSVVRGDIKSSGFADAVFEMINTNGNSNDKERSAKNSTTSLPLSNNKDSTPNVLSPTTTTANIAGKDVSSDTALVDNKVGETTNQANSTADTKGAGADAIFRPKQPILLESSDICIDIERHTKGSFTWSLPTSVAHVWFNVFFEGHGPEQDGVPDNSGVFEIEWDALDGLKGSSKKGTRAFDRIAVLWKAVAETKQEVHVPKEGEKVEQSRPANWRGESHVTVDSEDEGTQPFIK